MGPVAMTEIKNKGQAKAKLRKAAKRKQPAAKRKAAAMDIATRSGSVLRRSIGGAVGVDGPITLEKIRTGLPATSVVMLSKRLKLTQGAMMDSLNMRKQTFRRRMEAGALNESESDRVARYAQLLVLATELFEDEDAAAQWLKTPAPALGNETPLVHATTEMGARHVERLIGRLEHGIPT